jgi:Mrp family chromosome partitioning ATPase
MERIQSAITKARKARKAREGDAPDDAMPAGAATVGVPVPRSEPVEDLSIPAWSSLAEFRPNAGHLERNRLISLSGGAAAVPFANLRTRLLHLMRDKGWRRLAITSPGPGCGKSTMALNLALGLSRLADVRTVLIEADLRRPALAQLLGTSMKHQISDVIAAKAEPAEHMLRIGTNLAIGTNRSVVPNSAELLQSPEAAKVFDRIEADYQPTLMIFDLPPMLVSDDTMAALGLMDCALIVAATESTTISEIDRCERELASRTNVVGVALNKCRYLEKSEGYGYY